MAKENGLTNLEYRLGDLEAPPIADQSLDLAFFSQSLHHALHPQLAVDASYRLLKPGGRIVILDLKRHNFEQAQGNILADDLARFLSKSGELCECFWSMPVSRR